MVGIRVAKSVDEYEDNEEHREEQVGVDQLSEHEEVRFDAVAEHIKQVALLHVCRAQRLAASRHFEFRLQIDLFGVRDGVGAFVARPEVLQILLQPVRLRRELRLPLDVHLHLF